MPPQRRKIISCGTCRRLRTRCEKLPGLNVCRRCDRLRIECNFPNIRLSLDEARTSCGPSTDNQVQIRPEAPGEVQQRLSAIEDSLAEIKVLLANSSNPPKPSSECALEESRRSIRSSSGSPANDGVVEEFSKTAPISVIRNLGHIITGTSPDASMNEGLTDCVSIGLVNESLCHTIFRGLQSLPLKRYGLDFNPWEMRYRSPLLFGASVLTGLYTIQSLCNSELHISLFEHVEGLATKAILRTPLPLESVRAFMMLSTWDLVPAKLDRYIDSWLMSGIGLMHGLLTIDFPRSIVPPDWKREMTMRTWNLLCLTHLEFSVGTGRPPVLGPEHLENHETSLGDSWDKKLNAQTLLFTALFAFIVAKNKSFSEMFEYSDIERWRTNNKSLIEADDSLSLLFAYSCAQLILYRHLLKVLTGSLQVSEPPERIQARTDSLIELAIYHSLKIMNLYLTIVASDVVVTPAFNSLMCTNAAVTVVEFKHRVKNARETSTLIKTLHSSIENIGRPIKAMGWAASVMDRVAMEARET
ncbi:hypothetical protein BGZ60DRAFT_421941 [Tricladium varicosporioides]|nr:hypothetical protein BGZ60DRAFT_421941 [Hymenoscyphus varicosporioides]